jgi:hypothetical protein
MSVCLPLIKEIRMKKIFTPSYFTKNNRIIIWLVILALGSINFGCSNDSDSDDEISEPDVYYVNYIIKAPGPYGRISNWTASTPDGTYSNYGYQVPGWKQTYGPVNKGFTCAVNIGHYQGGTPTIEIHVAKNEQPYTLKATVTGASTSYVINY